MPRDAPDFPTQDHFRVYGSDAVKIQALAKQTPEWSNKLDDALPYIGAQVVWAVRQEMAQRLEDVMARRPRSLLLDAQRSMAAANLAATIMAKELGRDQNWVATELDAYRELAMGYMAESI